MIANSCRCGWACCSCGTATNRYGNTTGFLTITGNTTSNTTNTTNTPYGNRRPTRSALELERELRRFELLAKWRPKRPIVKVDEKRLIAKPGRELAKPHRSQSSRAALSVRQFAQRVK